MLKIKNFYFNDLHECCSVAWDETGECVIIDPGFYTDTERDQLKGFIEGKGLKPVKILLTHAHFDHIFGLKECARMYGIPVYMDPADKETLQSAEWYCRQFGFRTPQTDVDTEDIHDGVLCHIVSDQPGADVPGSRIDDHFADSGKLCARLSKKNILQEVGNSI